jgi:hypothetical protein
MPDYSTSLISRRTGSLVAHIGPDPALFDTLAKPLVAHAAIQHPDGCVVRMQQVAGHDVRLDPCDQRLQRLHGPSAPANQRAFGDIRSHASEDFVLAIQRQMVVKLRDQNMGQQVWPRHTARDRAAGGRFLHHPLTTAAGFLDAGDLDHLHLSGDHVQQFADILTHHTQIAATVGAAPKRPPPFTPNTLAPTHSAQTGPSQPPRRTSGLSPVYRLNAS